MSAHFIFAACLALALAGCAGLPGAQRAGSPTASPSGEPSTVLRVAAAADVKPAFDELALEFERQQGVKVELVFASSGTLSQQIANGAPYDVFASADLARVQQLASKGFVDSATVRIYAVGRIVLAWKESSGYNIKDLRDLRAIDFRSLALANPDHAPYGSAGKEALRNAGLWGYVESRVVYGENVVQAFQFLETGATEVAIVALSLAKRPGIRYVEIDQSLYSPLKQGVGAISGSKRGRLARQWIDFLLGPLGQEIMKKYGYGPPI